MQKRNSPMTMGQGARELPKIADELTGGGGPSMDAVAGAAMGASKAAPMVPKVAPMSPGAREQMRHLKDAQRRRDEMHKAYGTKKP